MTINDRFRLDGEVAVVTGAGRGIGAATAVALAQAGADVVISSRTADQLQVVATQIRAAGRRALVVPADLSDLAAIASLAQAAYDEFGRLNVVVNNVGGAMPQSFLDTSARDLEGAFRFNVSTAHELTRAAVPLLLKSEGQRSVVNITSVMGRAAERGYLAYGAAKAALSHWTRLAALDLAPKIRVNAIAVGSVMTSALDLVAAMPELKSQMESKTPLGRIGDAEEVAAAVVYLSAPSGNYLAGKIVEVDGGLQQPNLDLGFGDV